MVICPRRRGRTRRVNRSRFGIPSTPTRRGGFSTIPPIHHTRFPSVGRAARGEFLPAHMPEQWSNWAGSITCRPQRIAMPSTEAELCALVRDAAAEGLDVRVAGTGHSFTPLVATDGLLLSLDRWTGIESADVAGGGVTVRAGTKLHDLGEELLALGLAQANLGDVDVQSVAGAVSTGTHGTGRTLGSISTQVTGLRLVSPAGELIDISAERDPELLEAARVALGTLGVLSAVTLRVQPAFRLHETVWRERYDICMERLAER